MKGHAFLIFFTFLGVERESLVLSSIDRYDLLRASPSSLVLLIVMLWFGKSLYARVCRLNKSLRYLLVSYKGRANTLSAPRFHEFATTRELVRPTRSNV
jgi:hypothetical protein